MDKVLLALAALTLLGLLLPFLMGGAIVQGVALPEWSLLSKTFFLTFLQALMSALACSLLGVIGGIGLSSFGAKSRRFFESLALLPTLLPSLFAIFAAFFLWHPFPYGLTGIVFVHTLVMAGFVAVSISKSCHQQDMLVAIEVSKVLGASGFQFWSKIGLFKLKPTIIWSAVSVFVYAFMSFSIPLIASKSKIYSVELLVWDLAMMPETWKQALGVSLLQTILVVMMFGLLNRMSSHDPVRHSGSSSTTMLNYGQRRYSLLALMASLAICFSYLRVLFGSSFSLIEATPQNYLIHSLLYTFLIGLISSLLAFGFCIGVCALFFYRPWYNLQLSWVGLSASLLAFVAFVVRIKLLLTEGLLAVIFLGGLMTLSLGPSLLRGYAHSAFLAYTSDIQAAKLLGANKWSILWKVLLPQVYGRLRFVSVLVGVYAMGDFAISRAFFDRPQTLALQAQALISSYRLADGMLLLLLILALGAVLFFIWPKPPKYLRN
ncbi:MAG: hypothetical protein COT74_09440 [Bdellovibrionales bacterium CG10_big_fil_rev_8_21_14_0_10_45_34]|nr:MAG: hypothetical protein COT74_09440 [Bdellovibrionales bacterium CG10_big_fil_rev_8_21_14_0_10_45_34]